MMPLSLLSRVELGEVREVQAAGWPELCRVEQGLSVVLGEVVLLVRVEHGLTP